MTRNRFYLALCIFAAVVLQFGAIPSMAQSGGGNSSNQYTLEQSTYHQVERIQKLMGANKYKKAIALGKSMLPSVKKQSNYAEALVSYLVASSYLVQKEYNQAETYLKRIVDLDALQPTQQTNAIQELASVYLISKNYTGSIRLYQQVLAQYAKRKNRKITPDPALYYHLGLAYSYRADSNKSHSDYTKALRYIKEGIQKRKALHEKKPKKYDPVSKDWYDSWFVVAYKMNDYHEALNVAKFLVAHWPKDKDFWNYYANTELLLHQDQDATAIYGLMYKRGMLKSKDDYLQYVSLLLEQKAPYKAATVMTAGIDKGIIPKSKDNYEQLSSSWMAAREWDKALEVLGKEAALSKSGKVYLSQAQIYLQRRDFTKAKEAAENALKKGGMSDNNQGQTLLALGEAQYELKNYDSAIKTFKKAEKYKKQKQNAENWIKYVAQNRKGG